MVRAVAILGFSFALSPAFAQVDRFALERTPEKLLHLMDTPPQRQLVIDGEIRDPRARAFMEFYSQEVLPRLNHFEALFLRSRVWRVLFDSASYRSPAEKQEWVAHYRDISQQINAYQVDRAWTETLHRWKTLSEGLQGDLPEQARTMYHERELESFAEEFEPLLNELSQLEKNIDEAQANVPANETVGEIRASILQTVGQFKAGEIDFAEAQTRLTAAYASGGSTHIGYQLVEARGSDLNRIAVIRSQLAQSKGYTTWARYMLEMNGTGYTEEYRGPERQIGFLTSVISILRPAIANYYTARKQALGIENADIRKEHLTLLSLPNTLQIARHFPAKKATDIWQKITLEAGFPPAVLQKVTVDDGNRKGKDINNKYMMPLILPYAPTQRINADTLNIIPTPEGSDEWQDGAIFVLQNYPTDGIDNIRLAAHEITGHAVEKLTKNKELETSESNGSVEVPSTTMEHLTLDPEILFRHAVEVDGQRPSLERIRGLVENQKFSSLLQLMANATSALFDIKVWDVDYAAPGAETFVQHTQKVAEEVDRLEATVPAIDSPIESFYSYLSTGHFISGRVRYIGYVYAKLGAAMMVDFISDELERRAGRRSWVQQPELANIVINSFYKVGWRKKFPTNIEEITGRSFAPAAALAGLIEQLSPAACEVALTNAANLTKK